MSPNIRRCVTERKLRVLCVCIGGTVRSVGMKDVLNGDFRCNAIAASAVWQDEETLDLLCRWADRIVPVVPQDWSHHACPERDSNRWRQSAMWKDEHAAKVRVANLGEDIWGNARHPELRKLCVSKAEEVIRA